MSFRLLPRVLKQLDGISGKYASAAYVAALTKGEKTLNKVETDLKIFHDVLKGDSADATKLRTFFNNPTIAPEEREKILSALSGSKGGADTITRNLFEVLSDNGRLSMSEAVIDDFMSLISAHSGEVKVLVTSAKVCGAMASLQQPLDKSFTSKLESVLKGSQYAKEGKSVKFEYGINPGYLGGFSVTLGDRSVDLSVANRVFKYNRLIRDFRARRQRFAPSTMHENAWHAYKTQKEAWVTGQAGSSVFTINLLSSVALLSYILWAALHRHVARCSLTLDFLTLVLPIALGCTAAASHLGVLIAVLGICIAIACATMPAPKIGDASAPDCNSKSYLTVYRVYLMLLTVLCILAVDFPIFPRAFAKTESWGTSLMDLGVGSFVFSLGIVSLHRGHSSTFAKRLQRAVPLFLLGFARVLLVKRTDYPEHVTEYGVHWNFFITMGCLMLTLEIFQRGTPLAPVVAGLLVSGMHEAALNQTQLGKWALQTERDPASWASLNKEGLASLPGYIAIALLGLDVGNIVFCRDTRQTLRALTLRAILYWGVYMASVCLGMTPSRRLANFAYVVWNAAYNSLFLLGFAALSTLFERWKWTRAGQVPVLFAYTNRHAMGVFLLANVVTGAVNLVVHTMYTPAIPAALILATYLLLVVGFFPWVHLHGALLSAPVMWSHAVRLAGAVRAPVSGAAHIQAVRMYATSTRTTLDDYIAQGLTLEVKKHAKLVEYREKLEAKAKEQGLESAEELAAKATKEREAAAKEAVERRLRVQTQATTTRSTKPASVEERDQAMQDRLRSMRANKEARKLKDGNAISSLLKPLASFMNVDKMANEEPDAVGKLWTAYHTMNDKLSAVISASTYTAMLENGARFPSFVLPLPKRHVSTEDGPAENAFEMEFMQWIILPRSEHASASAPPPSIVLFTPLAEFKLRQEYAQPSLILSMYPDFVDEKDIVLLRGEVSQHQMPGGGEGQPMMTQDEAQLLVMCMQRFYHLSDVPGIDTAAETRCKLLKVFHTRPEEFDVDLLLDSAFSI
ncbi:Glucosaminyl phosphatidylinositol (GlcN-PI) nositol acylation protein [Malassezia vespertilionis]|uniref:Glucosaminyl phosphatidylinositol (GlcN-PI) nositol acylation protein n=1 Tax=Malassezia vespertilionis TaxID=2020962 RepID=UPI0024B25FCE|nr:Glucosaminyl phosphatidylinositol (GlcN-PI) nositol acylation protein [Malassezia vespertilionis]WFD07251.1 Glucosaminyl phosphatidylinositol (GlcN-PI) nositol acylation protein [Malassezia vespertilionis]